jgi:hypothetical protein
VEQVYLCGSTMGVGTLWAHYGVHYHWGLVCVCVCVHDYECPMCASAVCQGYTLAPYDLYGARLGPAVPVWSGACCYCQALGLFGLFWVILGYFGLLGY